jgi:predicted molibdopterin-dependent oxidoreductase YjgC
MGVTRHTCGEDSVHAIINLALAQAFAPRLGVPINGAAKQPTDVAYRLIS